MFAAHLVDEGKKSTTIKSYISAIKAILLNVSQDITEDRVLLASITRACKIRYDKVNNKLPIKKGVVNIMVNTLNDFYDSPQPYLVVLYQAMILTTYYGLFRIGELTASPHVVKACDVHIATNKKKLMFVLHSSKTHDNSDKPQVIKISTTSTNKNNKNVQCHPIRPICCCPFTKLQQFLQLRRKYANETEQFFVFADGSPVTQHHYRRIVRDLLKKATLDHRAYCVHDIRVGQASDMLDMGLSVETIRKFGRWKSTSVYTYLQP